jgi:hypothetical protein
MSTGALMSFCHVDGRTYVVLPCQRAQLCRFSMSTGTFTSLHFNYYSTFPTYFSSWGVALACRLAHLCCFGMPTGTITSLCHVDGHSYVVLACRQAPLLFYTLSLYYSLFPTYFLASRGLTVHLLFHTLHHFTIFPFQPTFWHRGASFWHVDGHIYYFTLYYSPFPTYFLASRGVFLACRRKHLYTSIPCLHFTIIPFQPTFWHRGTSFLHVDGDTFLP